MTDTSTLRPHGQYWVRFGVSHDWEVMRWDGTHFWGSAGDGYRGVDLDVGHQVFPPGPPAPTHRHEKRGTEYVLIGIGKMQSLNWAEHADLTGKALGRWNSVDMREVAIYRSVDDDSLWVRPREEFEDGRFETIEARP